MIDNLLAWDFLRYLIFPALAFGWFHLFRKSHWTSRLIQKSWSSKRDHLREIRYLLPSVGVFALIGFGVIYGKKIGLFKLHFGLDISWFKEIGILILMILAHDAYFYWTHRFMHLPKVFHSFHRIHHLSHNPSPWSAYSFSLPEALVQALFVPLFLLIAPVHVLTLAVFLGHMSLRSVLAHMNVEVFPKWLANGPWWIATSTHHNLHHQIYRGNFGIYFRYWDKLMGTDRHDSAK